MELLNMKTYKGLITELPENGIFVFGSNTEGRHGGGAALIAKQKFRAVYGQSKGLQGQSYAIVTKDLTKSVHPSISKVEIKDQIKELYRFARLMPNLDLYIAYSGRGVNLNGYTPEEMANLFKVAATCYIEHFEETNYPENIVFEEEFAKLLRDGI